MPAQLCKYLHKCTNTACAFWHASFAAVQAGIEWDQIQSISFSECKNAKACSSIYCKYRHPPPRQPGATPAASTQSPPQRPKPSEAKDRKSPPQKDAKSHKAPQAQLCKYLHRCTNTACAFWHASFAAVQAGIEWDQIQSISFSECKNAKACSSIYCKYRHPPPRQPGATPAASAAGSSKGHTGSKALVVHGPSVSQAISIRLDDKPRRTVQVKRHRNDITICLDVSGSMAGGKLTAAKQGILDLYDKVLIPGDTLSVIVFNDQIEVKVPRMGVDRAAKAVLEQALGEISASSRTAMYDAVHIALEELRELAQSNAEAHHGHHTAAAAAGGGGGGCGSAAAGAGAGASSSALVKSAGPKQRNFRHDVQLIVFTDGQDNVSRHTSVKINEFLRSPGAALGKAKLHTLCVGVGSEATDVLNEMCKGCKHATVLQVSDSGTGVADGFRRLSDEITTMRQRVLVLQPQYTTHEEKKRTTKASFGAN